MASLKCTYGCGRPGTKHGPCGPCLGKWARLHHKLKKEEITLEEYRERVRGLKRDKKE